MKSEIHDIQPRTSYIHSDVFDDANDLYQGNKTVQEKGHLLRSANDPHI